MRPSEFIHTIYRDREECSRFEPEGEDQRLRPALFFGGTLLIPCLAVAAYGINRLFQCGTL